MKNFDALLETALQEMRDAEPIPGIEARMMTRVRASAARSKLPRWLPAGAVAAGVLAAVLISAGKPARKAQPFIAARTVTPVLEIQRETAAGIPRRTSLPVQARDANHGRPARSRLRHDASLRIAPVVIESLRMQPLEVASLPVREQR